MTYLEMRAKTSVIMNAARLETSAIMNAARLEVAAIRAEYNTQDKAAHRAERRAERDTVARTANEKVLRESINRIRATQGQAPLDPSEPL